MKSAKPAAKRRIPAYQKGGLVRPPVDIDQLSALPPEKRGKYEKMAERQTERDRMAPAKKPPAPAKPPMKK
jgi:hypothetical protein